MKKILQIAAFAAFTCTATQSFAQPVAGSISPDWTLTDINGISHNLYTYLDAGKTVFIDISATWCEPCWNYHQTGALEDLWVNHGPAGGTGVSGSTTDDCMVFFVEGDDQTNHACLIGDASNCTGNGTNGDWTAGVSHPIFDPTASTNPTCNAFNNFYSLTYFPTIIMICPDHTMQEVGADPAATLYANKTSTCPSLLSNGSDAKMTSAGSNSSLGTCDSIIPTFLIGNNGTTVLSSATITYKVDGITQKVKLWTGSLASYATANVTGVKLGAPTTGSHTITATVSNPNGGVDPTIPNNTSTASFLKYPSLGGAAVVETFESGAIPSTWTITNGGNTLTWENVTGGYSSSKSVRLKFYSIPSGDIDMMELPPMSFIGAVSPSLTFNVAYCGYTVSTPENDQLEVMVSGDCGTTWTDVYNKAGNTLKTIPPQTAQFVPSGPTQWRNETVSLNSYVGLNSVLVKFKGTSAYGNNLYVDNVNINGLSPTTGISVSDMPNSLSIYPNPITNKADIDFNLTKVSEVSIVMYNLLGETVFSNLLGEMNQGSHSIKLDAQNLNSGIYFITLNAGNNKITKKVVINK